MRQAFVPVRQREPVGLFDFTLVEHAVKGASGPAGVLVAADWFHPAGGDAGQPVNGHGKVVPAACPLVGYVVDARHEAVGQQYGPDDKGQVGGTGGGTYLVGHDGQLLALVPQPQHGLDKVVAVGRVEPGGAEYDALGAIPGEQLFPFEFGRAVDRLRVGLHRLGVGAVAVPVEYVVGRDVYHAGPAGSGRPGQVAHGLGVDAAAQLHVLLGLVDLGIGGAVDHIVYRSLGQRPAHRLGVADVELGHVGKPALKAAVVGQEVAHLVAQLSVGAGNQYLFGHD